MQKDIEIIKLPCRHLFIPQCPHCEINCLLLLLHLPWNTSYSWKKSEGLVIGMPKWNYESCRIFSHLVYIFDLLAADFPNICYSNNITSDYVL